MNFRSNLIVPFSGQQAAVLKDPVVAVNRVVWSPDGSLFGM
jgi:hypothetical protein